MINIIISNGRKSFLVNVMSISTHQVEWFFNHQFCWNDRVYINGEDTGFTVKELFSSYRGNKRLTKKWASYRNIIDMALGNKYPIHGYKVNSLIRDQKVRLFNLIKDARKPFEEVTTLYEEHCNQYKLVDKNNLQALRLINMGVLEWIPEGTFFGHRPKEYSNILIKPTI